MLKIVSKSKISRSVNQTLARAGVKKMMSELIEAFPQGEIFVVGGTVRDILLNRDKIGDLDVVVRKIKISDLKKFLNRFGKVNLVGKNFGVLKFKPMGSKNNNFIDFALPRTEHSFGTGGYRDFNVQSNPNLPLREDLSRRDFTINALAWCIKRKKLIDEFGGINDLRGGIIRTVGKPKERFREDYSRILRAIRFATELNFEIENRTWQAIKKSMKEINKKRGGKFIVPREAIAKEFLKSFYADPLTALGWWDSSTAFGYLIPEISELKRCKQPKEFHSEGNAWKHTELCLNVLRSKKFKKEFGNEKPALYVSLGILFHDIAKPRTIKQKSKKRAHIGFPGHAKAGAKMTREIIKRLKLESYKKENIDIEVRKLTWLVGEHMTILANDPRDVRHREIEEYFMQKDFPKNYLMQICYCDIHGSITGTNLVNLYKIHYLAYKNRIRELKARFPKGLPKPILNGNEVIDVAKIKPGSEVAELMEMLREAQLGDKIKTKLDAEKLLKKAS